MVRPHKSVAAGTKRTVIAERILEIEQIMRDAQWERGKTNRVLSEKWGITVGAVDNYAAEAGRRVRAAVAHPEEVQTTVCAALSTIVRVGMQDGDRKNVIKAADTWSRIAGGRSADRLEIEMAHDTASDIAITESVLAALRSKVKAE